MKLISMVDFVLKFSKTNRNSDEFENTITDYASFLKQLLTLGMFVPCDENGNVLEEPKFHYQEDDLQFLKGVELTIAKDVNEKVKKYKKAKEKVFFEGFKIEDIGLGSFMIRKNGWILMKCSKAIGAKWENIKSYADIESLVCFDIELTESAIKQLKNETN